MKMILFKNRKLMMVVPSRSFILILARKKNVRIGRDDILNGRETYDME